MASSSTGRPRRPALRGVKRAALAVAVLALSVQPADAHQPGVCLPTERCEAWSATYDDSAVPADRDSQQYVQAVLANDTTVFTVVRSVAFSSSRWQDSSATANVVAYDRVTGAVRWTSRLEQSRYYAPEHAALSPDGSTLYVTGTSYDAYPSLSADERIVTTAQATGTGAVLWSATRDSPDGKDNANGIAVAPDGSEVYVVGVTGATDFLTVAYGADGSELWSRTYGDPGQNEEPLGVAVSAGGDVLAVTGVSGGIGRPTDYLTVAYSLRGPGGRQLWARTYDGIGQGISDSATAVAADADRFYVTGGSDGAAAGYDYATLAYGVHTGAQVWAARWSSGPGGFDNATHLATANGRVVVTGRSGGGTDGTDFDAGTVGYDAATGRQLWAARFASARQDGYPTGLALSRDGATAYVVTTEAVYLTGSLPPRLGLVAYDVATGAERWHTFLDSAGGSVRPAGVAVGGGSVAVAGDMDGATTHDANDARR
jgi:sugar lactone lactonase YvrE